MLATFVAYGYIIGYCVRAGTGVTQWLRYRHSGTLACSGRLTHHVTLAPTSQLHSYQWRYEALVRQASYQLYVHILGNGQEVDLGKGQSIIIIVVGVTVRHLTANRFCVNLKCGKVFF